MGARRVFVGLAFASLAAACGTSKFGEEGMTPNPEEGRTIVVADGGGGDSPGPGPTDAATETNASDASDAGDGAIPPFGVACQVGDVVEAEPNDVASASKTFTVAACGELSALGDIDYFRIDLPGTGPVMLGYSTSGNATLAITGPGLNASYGSAAGGGYKFMRFDTAMPPGEFTIRLMSSSVTQRYRVVVRQ